jgi:hypothetical protein
MLFFSNSEGFDFIPIHVTFEVRAELLAVCNREHLS